MGKRKRGIVSRVPIFHGLSGQTARLTYGHLPTYGTFEEAFDENVPNGRYSISLSRSDSRAADGTSIGDGDYTSRELYKGLKELVEKWNEGDEDAGDLASSILASIGIEWV